VDQPGSQQTVRRTTVGYHTKDCMSSRKLLIATSWPLRIRSFNPTAARYCNCRFVASPHVRERTSRNRHGAFQPTLRQHAQYRMAAPTLESQPSSRPQTRPRNSTADTTQERAVGGPHWYGAGNKGARSRPRTSRQPREPPMLVR
jgi:hypothetical protein